MFRRDFLKRAGAGMATLALGRGAWAAAPGADAAAGGRLVIIMLRGAVDGLSVVVPYADPAYYRLRSSIAIAPPDAHTGAALDLDGRFGLHPALAPLLPYWREGSLAFVHASGSHDPTRSHFDAQDYLETGTPGVKSTPDGWINRLLGVFPGERKPTEALSMGPSLPRAMLGANPVTSLPNGRTAVRPDAMERAEIANAFDRVYTGNDPLARAYRDAQTGRRQMMNALTRDMDGSDRGAPPAAAFRAEAERLASLFRSQADIRIAFIPYGGWDTHIGQGGATGALATRLGQLGDGLATLAQRLGPALADTSIVVVSEFGRTVRENGTGGTDHGHGNVMWLLGGPIAGGRVHGRWPGLDDAEMYEGRDLAVTTDFRTVLSTLLVRQMALAPSALASVFPGLAQSSMSMAGLLRG
jgi:uncharacterized protein (DUF1501 family)